MAEKDSTHMPSKNPSSIVSGSKKTDSKNPTAIKSKINLINKIVKAEGKLN
jgi:hypothetical protein